MRFDFTYHENLSPADIQKVEDLVNEKIIENIPVKIEYMTLPEAIKHGALAFFGDKYNPEKVRMVEIPNFSTELCGGTHVRSTGDIGVFKITDISALSAGHRRITAVTGPRALELFQETFAITKSLGQDFKVQKEQVIDAVLKQKEDLKKSQHEIKQLKKQMYTLQIPQWLENAEMINSIAFLYQPVTDATNEDLKELAQQLATKKPGFYFLTSIVDNKGIYVAQVSPNINIDLKKIAMHLKNVYGIRGGGTDKFLQGGTTSFDTRLKEDLKKWIKEL